jgi:hypothetical protein
MLNLKKMLYFFKFEINIKNIYQHLLNHHAP